MDRNWDAGAPAGGGLPALPPELDPRGRRRHHRHLPGASGALHSGGIIVKILAAAMSLFIVVYIGYLWNTVRGLNDVGRLQLSSLGGHSVNVKTGKVTTRYDIDGKDQNILIAGNDDRSALTLKQVRELKVGRDGGSLNTDTMMIVHVPADGSQATLISLPRDSYVNIPGYGMNKLNAAYPLGYNNARGDANARRAAGADKLIQVVEKLTGLNIDHFVQVSLLGFVTISDAVGGVSVDLCHSVNDTVAHNESIGLSGGSGLVMSKGMHTIKGVQALEFVRQREGLPRGDIDRTARQRYFLTAAFRTVASAGTLLNIGKLQNLVSAVDKSIYVDQGLNMLDLAKQMSNLSANNIRGEAIPTDHYEDTPVGNAGIIIPSQVRAFVHRLDFWRQPVLRLQEGAAGRPEFGVGDGAQLRRAERRRSDCGVDARHRRLLHLGRQGLGTRRDDDDHLSEGFRVAGEDVVALRARRLGASGRCLDGHADAGLRRHHCQVEAEPRREPEERQEEVAEGDRLEVHQLSPEALFDRLLAADPGRPFVTYYDEASGERSELSRKSLANWVAKTHFLLVDELGLGVGDTAVIALPPHWISVPALLGCLTAGLALAPAGAGDVAFAEPARLPVDAPDVYVIAPSSAAVGLGDAVPHGASDFVTAVRPQPDKWPAVRLAAGPGDDCLPGATRAEVVERAVARAAELGAGDGARVLTTADWTTPADWVDALCVPLVVGGSLVVVRNADEAVVERRMDQERASVRIR